MTKKRMESHYRLEAILVLDDKLESFVLIDFFLLWTKMVFLSKGDYCCNLGLMSPHQKDNRCVVIEIIRLNQKPYYKIILMVPASS